MFMGRVAEIDEIGRTTANRTVASDSMLLDIDMPRKLWAPDCHHVLYNSGCGLAEGTYSASGTVGSRATMTRFTGHRFGVLTPRGHNLHLGRQFRRLATIKAAATGLTQ